MISWILYVNDNWNSLSMIWGWKSVLMMNVCGSIKERGGCWPDKYSTKPDLNLNLNHFLFLLSASRMQDPAATQHIVDQAVKFFSYVTQQLVNAEYIQLIQTVKIQKKHSIILSSLSSLGSVLELLLWLCDFLNCWYLWQYLW